jgi:mediator of RNA polymerase II transcription subunit 17
MSTHDTGSDSLIFPQRQRVRLRVSLRNRKPDGTLVIIHNSIKGLEDNTLQGSLRSAQQEVVEQEIFSVLVREAPNLLTAASRVSERLVVIDAAENLELIFELVRSLVLGPWHPASHNIQLGR